MTSLFTQSGFEDLIPIGVAYASIHIAKGKGEAIREEFFKDGIEFVFNCQYICTPK